MIENTLKEKTKFSRGTVTNACSLLVQLNRCNTHTKLDRFILEYGLEDRIPTGNGNSKDEKANQLIIILSQEKRIVSSEKGPISLDQLIVEKVVAESHSHLRGTADYIRFSRYLEIDGWCIHEIKVDTTSRYELIPFIPGELNLATRHNEVETILTEESMHDTLNHLRQAKNAYCRDDYSASNAQVRTFLESLFEEMVRLRYGSDSVSKKSHENREKLAKGDNPIFDENLGDWKQDGCGYIRGLYQRLHAEGSHPGSSNKEDASFRLHIVVISAHYYLRVFQKTKQRMT